MHQKKLSASIERPSELTRIQEIKPLGSCSSAKTRLGLREHRSPNWRTVRPQ